MEFFVFVVVASIMVLINPEPAPLPPPPPPPPDRVILLPEADGSVGRVLVSSVSGSQEISHPYEAAAVGDSGGIDTSIESADAIRARYAALLSARPKPPRSFLLYFMEGTDELTPESEATLTALKRDAESRAAPEVLVIGYTDRVGSNADNDALSLKRARTIADDLLAYGIKPLHLDATGRGERNPLVPTADGVDEPRNRRVEVSIR